MKSNILAILAVITLAGLLAGCEKDNYDPPTSILTGRIVYQDQAIGVRTPTINLNYNGSTTSGVQVEIWQYGYQLRTKIPQFVAYDGTWSAALFDGDYKITLVRGNGPWVDMTDTISVSVRGNGTLDIPVVPFYLIKNDVFQLSGTTVTATFNVQTVNTTKALESVRIYLNKTILVDQNNQLATGTKLASAIPDLNQPVTVSVAIPASLTTADYCFARVGVKIAGMAEVCYALPQKIALK
jgi:hypothetical protein